MNSEIAFWSMYFTSLCGLFTCHSNKIGAMTRTTNELQTETRTLPVPKSYPVTVYRD